VCSDIAASGIRADTSASCLCPALQRCVSVLYLTLLVFPQVPKVAE